ncbi:TPA: hypothetical protein DCG86_08980 [Candidatus Marinimicrobia bacterium]|nr:hypothetical protein [Candidatus Neomarinimicrobiota bacterium]
MKKFKQFGFFVSVCLLATSGQAQDSLFWKIQSMIDSVSIENIEAHIRNLEYAGGHESRVTFTPGKDSARVYIADYLIHNTQVDSVALDTFYVKHAREPYNTYPLMNVEAWIKGTGDPNRYVLLGAHYDASASRMGSTAWENHWDTLKAPGADDNATGVAAILEIARILSDSTFHFSEEYGIVLVAFAAEESNPTFGSGHHGSYRFASIAREKEHTILGAVSIDMIGYNAQYDYTAIVSNNNSEWLGIRSAEINEMYDIGLIMNDPPYPYATYSDHDRFWEQGYPAILMIENAPPWTTATYYARNYLYHTSYDTLGSVNLGLVKKVTQMNLGLAADLTGRVTSVPGARIPENYVLEQNYPNPFNPTTTIEYTVPAAGNVRITVYDIQGHEKVRLINSHHEPGKYTVPFDAGNLASGVYLYRLTAGPVVQTKKMMFIK